MALDRKADVRSVSEVEDKPPSSIVDDETDTDFHETLPKEVLKIKDITIGPNSDRKKTDLKALSKAKDECKETSVHEEGKTEIIATREKEHPTKERERKSNTKTKADENTETTSKTRKLNRKQTSESSNQSRQSDSLGSVIPVITISATESDEETLQKKESKKCIEPISGKGHQESKSDKVKPENLKKSNIALKALQRQNSVDSINEQKSPREKKPESGHKYQYSL